MTKHLRWFHGFCENIHSQIEIEVKHVLSVIKIIGLNKKNKTVPKNKLILLNFQQFMLDGVGNMLT